ncbi:microcin ABC transporter permease [Helicobacter didelphidarum]|uniref:Microcin ABC transporter permease n=1 Tax=Helicobacter didelphidarum TaxID=2040648 RepID=A0A3D8IJ72_9HELI|nr:microcin C ABC transporter permease YejB [Helicobacter didelphidarum]RDU64985.1 microcin ABC transporter permease [Helicobacter didelphidarum]
MFAYFCKRFLLMIPTLLGIITINFFIIQLAPGGPVEQMSAKIANSIHGESNVGSIHLGAYQGAKGLDSELLEQLKKMYGFDKPIGERFFLMLKHYIQFDFGESFYRQERVIDIIQEKLSVSISLGIFSTLIIYFVSIPLGIIKACWNGEKFDSFTSLLITFLYSIPSFLLAILLIILFTGGNFFDIFPLKGLVSDNFDSLTTFDRVKDYLWHLVLPITCICAGGFASLTLLVKNSFLDEMGKSYVLLARSKGASNIRILYGHIFRNAMLLIVSLFPITFVGMFFGANLLIEIIFSLDGLGLLGYNSIITRDYPIVFGTLFIFTLIGLIAGIISDMLYMVIDPRINFDKAI